MTERRSTVAPPTYGPNARPAHGEQILDAINHAQPALLLLHSLPRAAVIVFGRAEHVGPLADGLAWRPNVAAAAPSAAGWRAELVLRDQLIARLLVGCVPPRLDDAKKVAEGPSEEPQPPGATLLVCALEGVLAVTWSPSRTEVIGALGRADANLVRKLRP